MSVESTEIKSEIHNTGFNVMALNIFSLMPHLDELRIFLNEQRPHIIALVLLKLKLIAPLITVILKLMIMWLKEMIGIDMVEVLLCVYVSL